MTHAHDRPHPTRTMLVLGLAALAFALAQTTLIPAIPELQGALNTDESGVTWTLTGYLLSAAVFTPVVGRLGDIYGKRRMLVISLAAFAIGSSFSALTSSLWLVVAGRAVMGVGGGILPLCFGIVRDEFPRERVARSVGLLSATVGIGGGLGLVLGGVLIDSTSYRWIFWLGAAMAVVAAVSAQLMVPESPVRTPSRVDIRGAVVLGDRSHRAAGGHLPGPRGGLGQRPHDRPDRGRPPRSWSSGCGSRSTPPSRWPTSPRSRTRPS